VPAAAELQGMAMDVTGFKVRQQQVSCCEVDPHQVPCLAEERRRPSQLLAPSVVIDLGVKAKDDGST
jgi:hypothetical protein